jgi:CubicO group peptidase (beta-lactamase class C family)
MKSSHHFLSTLFLLVFLFGLLTCSTSATAYSDTPFDLMDAYVQARMQAASIPGGGYALVKDGKVVHVAAFGVADRHTMRSMMVDTPVMIGSVGKTFTALAIRQLYNAGKLDLSVPVKRYLPWFSLATPGAAEQITLQNLLDHKSGLSTRDGQNLRRFYRSGLTPEQVVRDLATIETNHPVGSIYEYSNLNFVVLGMVVEVVSGQSYADYLQEHIFEPLEMTGSTTDYEVAKANGLTKGHRYLFGIPVEYEEPFPDGIVAAGYQITTIQDMAHYLAALSNGGEYQAFSVVSPDGVPAGQKIILDPYWSPTHEYGFNDSTGHSGANLNANAAITYIPRQRLGVVVIYNANPYQFFGIAHSASALTSDLLRMYTGENEVKPSQPSTRTVYAYIDAVLLAIVLGTVVHAAKLRSWRTRLGGFSSRQGVVVKLLLADGLLPLMILLGLPLLIQLLNIASFQEAWPFLTMTLPDIAWTLLLVAVVLLISGIAKIWMGWRSES